MKSLGLYLHIPFCRSKCLYCDFCSLPDCPEKTINAYINQLCADLSDRRKLCRDHVVQTIYFGGGTPTILKAEQLKRLMDAIRQNFLLSTDCEITAECNPATGNKSLFCAMREMGFNRLSIGLQSADRRELRALGRIHTFEGFLQTWDQARAAGFENLSVDVMFGIPYQTRESFHKTLELVTNLCPEHLSAYALTLEKGTPLWQDAALLPLPGERETAQMYLDMVRFLSARGLQQYEISNFAREGYQSRHNCKYWNMEEYLGLGVAAHSDFGGCRFGNGRDLQAYLRGEDICTEKSTPGPLERENEYVMLQMRLAEGLDNKKFEQRFGHSAQAFLQKLEPWVEKGFLRRTPNGVAFTPKGFLVSNSILSEVVEFPG